MNYEIIVKPEAEYDIKRIIEWYEKENVGLGYKFVISLSKALDQINTNPFLFALKYRDTRLAFTNNFPYGIHYKIEEEKIIVLAVLHTKRMPRN